MQRRLWVGVPVRGIRSVWWLGLILGWAGIFHALLGCGGTANPPVETDLVITDDSQSSISIDSEDTSTLSLVDLPAQKGGLALGSVPELQIWPEEITLDLSDPGIQFVVQEHREGQTQDLTRQVTWEVEPAESLVIDGSGLARRTGNPVDGPIQVRAHLDEQRFIQALVHLSSSDIEVGRSWDYPEDIQPLLTHLGCNSGGCHGRRDGQNGFHLSFRGYDPEGDYFALTEEVDGRRIDLDVPENSLMLLKATGMMPHGGKQVLDPDSDNYWMLVDWISAHAPLKSGTTHGPVESIVVSPEDLLLTKPALFQIRVSAIFADGHQRDVTHLCRFETRDDSIVSIEPDGSGTLLRRGETDVVVSYKTFVETTRVATPFNPELDFDFAAVEPVNLIDEQVLARLERLRVPMSPPADDAAFFRRVSLDLTGHQPLPWQIREFLDNEDPEKRAKLVDRLISSPEFVDFWTIKLGDLLQVSPNRMSQGAAYLDLWLERQLERQTPWDDLVAMLLLSVGDPYRQGGGPVNYALDDPDPLVRAERTAQRFLGLRMQCAQCHDHPFDIWSQDNYFAWGAFFAKTYVIPANSDLYGPDQAAVAMASDGPLIGVLSQGTVTHLRTEQPAEPRLLDGTIPNEIPEWVDPRIGVVDWMLDPANPYFAKMAVNWTWGQMFGRGLVEPVDDLSASNPAVHPALLEALAKDFVDSGYDLQELIRSIANSRVYQASSLTVPGNESDLRLFSHTLPRPLNAHQMADALAQATGVPNQFADQPMGTQAIEVRDPTVASTVLDTFGRCSRDNGCSAVARPPLSLKQSLLLIGGNVVADKVGSLNGYLSQLLDLAPAPDEIVENLYLRTLCRFPTESEREYWAEELESASSLEAAGEDLFWALLNSQEFAFNH